MLYLVILRMLFYTAVLEKYKLQQCFIHFQGKGEMQTYWLLDSERKDKKGDKKDTEKKTE